MSNAFKVAEKPPKRARKKGDRERFYIAKYIRETECDVNWTELAQNAVVIRDFVSTALNLLFP
jgi:hypothetical protein